jgi:lipoprotein-anchoring transpeptidase ErfK/SrfK
MIRRLTVAAWFCMTLAFCPAQTVLRAVPVGPDDISDSDIRTISVSTKKKQDEGTPAKYEKTGDPVLVQGMPTKVEGDDAVRLQIFLDQSMFGPGVVDGRPGLFTRLAVASWNEVHGLPGDDWGAVLEKARAEITQPHAVALVPDLATAWVDPTLPTKKQEQAKRKRMNYRSIGEFMSERYHTSEAYLIKLNGASKIAGLKPRDSLIVPNIEPFLIERITGVKYDRDDTLSTRHAVVDTKRNQVRIFEAAPAALVVSSDTETVVDKPNRGLVASFPITPGQPQFIKYGQWELKSCLEFPVWRYDQQLLDTGKRSKNGLDIPAGPNSPVGVLWAGLSHPGIGMHGTADPETIGRARSHGCIRLANWDAIRLPKLIRPGATVEIR